jgi:predicted ribosome quality control (RQC) complex YloA/Tae2 family protein
MTKFFILKALCDKLATYKKLSKIHKVAIKIIAISFDKRQDDTYYFDFNLLTIYKKPQNALKEFQIFSSPFDLFLKNKLNNTTINKVEILNNDKILQFSLISKSSYKQELFYLIIEFIPRISNIIILNEQKIILQALYFKHFDNRNIQIGETFKLPSSPKIVFNTQKVDDINQLLLDNYLKINNNFLNNIKQNKIKAIKSKQLSLNKIYVKLKNTTKLMSEAKELEYNASLLLANLNHIEPYIKSITLKNEYNKNVTIKLDEKEFKPSKLVDKMFAKSKKLKAKIQNTHIQKDEITSKIKFYMNLINNLQMAKNANECEFLYPTQNKIKKKENAKNKSYASFEYEGFLIWLGRNESENIYLLKNSSSSDFWFHLQGILSCHIIVKTKKKTLPISVIKKASYLCASFSCNNGGVWTCDYTKRANVKIKNGANVEYSPFNSTTIKIQPKENI